MKVNTKEVRNVISLLDDIVKEYKDENPPKKRDWRTYEQQYAARLRVAFNELRPFVHEAVESLEVVRGTSKGVKPLLTLEQKVLALLLKHLIGKSNRSMAYMLILFSWLTGVSVSYKTIERLYSDEQVVLALHNLQALILRKKEIQEVDACGDGTGYSLTIRKHYASQAQKLKDKAKKSKKVKKKRRHFMYSFALMDLKTRMYLGYGMSIKNEKEAFLEAVSMVQDTGINIESLRLDKYYSNQVCVELFQKEFGKVKMYLIPKKNATVKGDWEWKRMLHSFVNDTKGFLKEYYKRNHSESGFAEDKKRTGWKLGQKRPDRLATANKLTHLWHNMHWLA